VKVEEDERIGGWEDLRMSDKCEGVEVRRCEGGR
jgi:hypothetical protein